MSETSIRPAPAPIRSGLSKPEASLTYTAPRPIVPEPPRGQAVEPEPQPAAADPTPSFWAAARVVFFDQGYGLGWMLLPGLGDAQPVAAGNDPEACAKAVALWAAKATAR